MRSVIAHEYQLGTFRYEASEWGRWMIKTRLYLVHQLYFIKQGYQYGEWVYTSLILKDEGSILIVDKCWELQGVQVEPPYTLIIDYNMKRKRMQMRDNKAWICLLVSFFPRPPPRRPKGPLWYLHDWRIWLLCLENEMRSFTGSQPLVALLYRKRCPNMSREKLIPGLNPGHCPAVWDPCFLYPHCALTSKVLLSGAFCHHIVWWSSLRQLSGKGTQRKVSNHPWEADTCRETRKSDDWNGQILW